ncbi:thiolase family protein [Candidatus Marinimicrobia bacterium]|jgi:acetyl-CoA acyltransferase|nr:thiolase family protein [Candidatus Neomarinimicrobiota bacterium]MDA9841859.1 thiolase family protein [Candidatus Neomarinimicrobiota bacterium]MDC1021209.1 thiolase family protein [Candidatus Neomarinimicrobiota bacterium]MDC3288016.1 thiolase family protein [Candidatus Neomarinimicrobiota bacterium]MDG2188865.1 thiolase family protein [Candidatus Neomarinimicrobiota bacterium]|tara:strand:+ start:529 stop:1662 length:1134 start_codon:yes stop_codon:yes gene_type:complete
MSNKAVIIDGVRSPIGTKGSALVGMRPDEIAGQVIKGLLDRNKELDINAIEDVSLGCAFPEGPTGMLVARGASILAGIPETAAANVINRYCGSAMTSLHMISSAIEAGDIEVGIAGGVEDMFSIPQGGFAPDFNVQLAEEDYYISMGEGAELLADKLDISRKEQEEFCYNSHNRAVAAQEEGKFDNEIIPIILEDGSVFDKDSGPRVPNKEKIESLNPAFKADGTVTAATSSPFSIGASAMLITSEAYAKEHGLKIRAYIEGRAVAGVNWKMFGSGPVPATAKALKNTGMSIEDIDVMEINEAFAAQALYCVKEANWDLDKVNLNGGAIALGHPLGISGTRIITTLLNVMEQQEKSVGLATMCVGTGQGITTIIKRG